MILSIRRGLGAVPGPTSLGSAAGHHHHDAGPHGTADGGINDHCAGTGHHHRAGPDRNGAAHHPGDGAGGASGNPGTAIAHHDAVKRDRRARDRQVLLPAGLRRQLGHVRPDVPVAITIQAAHVKAHVEVAEIAGGVMAAPTTPQVVAWYMSSPRLGQPGKMLLAGHLNWWGVPQGSSST